MSGGLCHAFPSQRVAAAGTRGAALRPASRREFLTKAAAIGVGGTVLGPLLSNGLGPARAVASTGSARFVAGRVSGTTASGFTLQGSDGQSWQAAPKAGARIWKSGRLDSPKVSVGDSVLACGDAQAGSGLAIDRMWVNLECLSGAVTDAGKEKLRLQSTAKDPVSIAVGADCDLALEKPLGKEGLAGLVGQVVQAVGYRDPNNALRATRIVSLSAPGPGLNGYLAGQPYVASAEDQYSFPAVATISCGLASNSSQPSVLLAAHGLDDESGEVAEDRVSIRSLESQLEAEGEMPHLELGPQALGAASDGPPPKLMLTPELFSAIADLDRGIVCVTATGGPTTSVGATG